MAHYLNEPFGDGWRRTARLAVWLSRVWGAKVNEDAEEMFLPTYRDKPQTDDEILAEFAKIPGFKRAQ